MILARLPLAELCLEDTAGLESAHVVAHLPFSSERSCCDSKLEVLAEQRPYRGGGGVRDPRHPSAFPPPRPSPNPRPWTRN